MFSFTISTSVIYIYMLVCTDEPTRKDLFTSAKTFKESTGGFLKIKPVFL